MTTVAPTAPTTTAPRTGHRASLVQLGAHQIVLELRQFVRSRTQVVFTILFPVMMLLIFGSIFSGDLGDGVSYTQYFVTGMVATGLMTTGFQALAIQIPIERDRGVLKRLQGTPMPRSVYFIGKVGMVFAIALAETVLLLAIAVPFFDVSLPATGGRWLTLIWVVVLGTTSFTLTGVAFSSVPKTARTATAVVTPVALLLQFISGVFFVFAVLPQWMQTIAAFFPLKWMTQGMRSVFLPDDYQSQEPAGSWEHARIALVLGLWLVGGLLVAVRTFRWRNKADG